jgi:hypothetical protein
LANFLGLSVLHSGLSTAINRFTSKIVGIVTTACFEKKFENFDKKVTGTFVAEVMDCNL